MDIKLLVFIYISIGILLSFLGPVARTLWQMVNRALDLNKIVTMAKKKKDLPAWKKHLLKGIVFLLLTLLYPLLYVIWIRDQYRHKFRQHILLQLTGLLLWTAMGTGAFFLLHHQHMQEIENADISKWEENRIRK